MSNKVIAILAVLSLTLNVAAASDLTKVSLIDSLPINTVKIDKFNQDRVLLLLENVNKQSINPLVSKIKEFAKTPKEPIYLVIDSNGGSLDAGQKLIDAIRGAKATRGLKTICIVTDDALSMAAVIASYCHQTFLQPNATMMFHEASYGIEGSATTIRTYVHYTDKYLISWEKRIAKQLGITYEQYVDLRRDSLWLTADEAVEMGFADGLIDNFYYEAEPPKEDIFTILFGRMLKQLGVK